MKRRVLTWAMLLAVSLLLAAGIRGSNAEDGGQTNRFKTVEIQVTEYVWELVSNQDGRVICQVIIEHPNRPSYDETIQMCGDQIFPPEPSPTVPASLISETPTPAATQTASATQEPFDLNAFFQRVAWRFVTTRQLTRTVQVPQPEMVVNITIPPNQQPPVFFARITAYEPIHGEQIRGIFGILNGYAFTCPSNRCDVPISGDSSLEFWATSTFGDESKHIQATLRIIQKDTGQQLEIASLTPITIFQDSCASIWGKPPTGLPSWAGLPATPAELNTMRPYQYLASQLLSSGFATAPDCPGGGLWAGGGANTCGLERSAQAVIDWQNQFDIQFWETGRSFGIPPILMKVMIGQESQFWPGNGRNGLYEYGLAQISPVGADVALRWDNDLFSSVCNGLLYDCSIVYGRLATGLQGTMRGGLMRAIDAQCPTCPHGIDMNQVYDSIPVIARTLVANCRQVRYIMDRTSGGATNAAGLISYEDLWRFTFVSYHSGYQCLYDAIRTAQFNDQPVDWEHISPFLPCPGSLGYVNDIWKALGEFDQFRIKPVESGRPAVQATFVPTVVPTATATPVLASSHILVLVYVDANNNNYPEPDERVEGAKVTVTFPNGTVTTTVTRNGEANIDLTGQPVGTDVIIALPELYRSLTVRVMKDGEIPAVFRLDQPVVPPVLP